MAYVANAEWPSTSPGLPFSVFDARGFCHAGADCLLILHGRTSEPVAVVRKALFNLGDELPILPLRAPRLGGSKWLFYLRAFLALRGSNRTVLITRNLNFLPWALALKRWQRLRVYFEAHNFWTDPALRGEKLHAIRRRYVRLERRWLRNVDGVICISEPLAQLYRQYYPALPVFTAVTGTTPEQPLPRSHFSYTLGYIGSFTESRYPLGIVMQALSAIREPAVRLLCIGAKRAQDVARMRDLAQHFGIAERVEVHPWVTGEALAQLKARIDVGVAVLADTFHTRIGCPVKILEYFSMGVPVVASQFDSTTTLLRSGTHGFLVANTPPAWEHAIRSVYADFPRYQHMVQQCATLATTLSWEHRARRIMESMESGVLAAPVPSPARRGGKKRQI
jgi:glycosyltransferase involved in cell wall biosynthesis